MQLNYIKSNKKYISLYIHSFENIKYIPTKLRFQNNKESHELYINIF